MNDRSDEFADQRVVVMGLGRFGGGVGVTRFLCGRGAQVLVTDQEPADKLAQSVAKLQDLIDSGQVTLRLGEHNVSDFTTCDLVVVNPAVKPGNRFVRAAEAAGIEVTTEMRLLVQRLPNRLRTIGVTGSAGKSTVTAMIGHVLQKALGGGSWVSEQGKDAIDNQHPRPNTQQPKVWVGGNIGGSLLPHLDEIGEDDWVVLELSSFMLERLRADAHFPGWSPHLAVITNISPNHLDWHGSMADYAGAKQVLLHYQRAGDRALLGGDAGPWQTQAGVHRFFVANSEVVSRQVLKIPGEHNRMNAAFVAAIGDAIAPGHGNQVVQQLADFPGLPHRLQLVAEHNGVRYFNDSKCTTPEAAKLAIAAFTEDETEKTPGIHLILGGYDKGSDFSSLASLAVEKCKAVYTIGQTGEAIASLCEGTREVETGRPETCGGVSWPAASAEVVRCGDLETAMRQISDRVGPGDVVLLSTGCASWGQFDNYEQRGERFIALVQQSIRR